MKVSCSVALEIDTFVNFTLSLLILVSIIFKLYLYFVKLIKTLLLKIYGRDHFPPQLFMMYKLVPICIIDFFLFELVREI